MARCCSHAPARHVISPSLPGRCVTPAPQQPPPGSLRHHRLGQAVRQCRPWGVKVVTRRTLSACVFLAARAFVVRRKVVGFRRFGGHLRGLSPPPEGCGLPPLWRAPPGTVPTSGPTSGRLWASAALAGTSGDCPHLRAALAGTSGDCPHLRAALAGTSGAPPGTVPTSAPPWRAPPGTDHSARTRYPLMNRMGVPRPLRGRAAALSPGRARPPCWGRCRARRPRGRRSLPPAPRRLCRRRRRRRL